MPSITYDITPTTNQVVLVNVQVPRYLHGQCLFTIYIFTKQRYSGARLIVYTHIRSQIMMVQVLGISSVIIKHNGSHFPLDTATIGE